MSLVGILLWVLIIGLLYYFFGVLGLIIGLVLLLLGVGGSRL